MPQSASANSSTITACSYHTISFAFHAIDQITTVRNLHKQPLKHIPGYYHCGGGCGCAYGRTITFTCSRKQSPGKSQHAVGIACVVTALTKTVGVVKFGTVTPHQPLRSISGNMLCWELIVSLLLGSDHTIGDSRHYRAVIRHAGVSAGGRAGLSLLPVPSPPTTRTTSATSNPYPDAFPTTDDSSALKQPR